eukprot:scaffold2944_cov155-Skeletonema_dohrnii-CCMP3373.AAC.32
MSDNAQHTASKTGSEEDLLHNMQHTTEQHHEHGQDRSRETAPAASTDLPFLCASPNLSILHHSLLFLFDTCIVISHSTHPTLSEDRDLTLRALMIKRERTLAELNVITHQLSLLDSITAKIDEEQFLTPSSCVDSKKATRLMEEDTLALDSRKPSSVSKQRHLEDTFLGREISFPRNRSSQESDVGNASLLNSTRSTAKLVESSTTFPPRMLSSHDAWYLNPHQHKKVQEESIESILLAAASELNMSTEIPKNDVDEYHASVDAAQVRATLEGRNCQGRASIPLPSRSPMLSQCSDREKGIQEAETAEDSKPPAESEDDAE